MTALERACQSGVAFCAAYYGYLLAVALCWWSGRRLRRRGEVRA